MKLLGPQPPESRVSKLLGAPVGRAAQPADIANVMKYMLDDEAGYLCGSVFFVDGGSDAMLRPEDF